MLFNKSRALAILAASVSGTKAFSFSFSDYFDFSIDLGFPTIDSCSTSDSIFQFGANVDLDFDLDLFKREEAAEVAKRASIPAPKAAFTVSDVAYAGDGYYKVTINFETIASSVFLETFAGEVSTVTLSGLGTAEASSELVIGGDAGITNSFQWSATIVIKASEHDGLFCLPDGFSIDFDISSNGTTDIFDLWEQYFSTSFSYSFSTDFSDAESVTALKRDLAVVEAQKRHDYEKRALDLGFDVSAFADFVIDLSSFKLPNFCWDPSCDASSSVVSSATSSAASSAASSAVSSASVSVTTSTVEPSSSASSAASSTASSAASSTASSAASSTASESVSVSTVTASYSSAESAEPSGESSVVETSEAGTPAITTPSASASSAVLANGTSTATEIATTVVTITSCSDQKCSPVPVTTGLTTVTSGETVYTTYCPLSSEEAASSTTYTTATTVTVACDVCEGGSSTVVSTITVTEPCSSTPATVAASSTPATVEATSTPATTAATGTAATTTPATVAAASTPATVAASSLVTSVSSSAPSSEAPGVATAEGKANGLAVPMGALLVGAFAALY